MQIIDLSLPIDETNPEAHPIKIHRLKHKKGIEHLNWMMMRKTLKGALSYLFGKRLIRKQDLREGEFLSLESILCSVHTGTHVDAPYHFGTLCEGKPAKKIDEMPLDWYFSDGVVLDLSSKLPGEAITKEDIISALKKINYTLKLKDIVLLRTGSDKYFGTKDYMTKFPGVAAEAINWLLEQGIKVIGIDALGFDRPYPIMFKEFLARADKSVLWPAHFCGRDKEYSHIERLANLDKIPKPFGFKVACFPVRIKDAGAAFARVVAIV